MEIISRKEALEQGLNRYFTGISCSHGHAYYRYTSNGACVLCTIRDSHRNQQKESYKEKARDRAKRSQKATPRDKKNAIWRKCYSTNTEYRARKAAASARRKQKYREDYAKLSPHEKLEVDILYEEAYLIGYHVDHIIPTSAGGKHEPSNLQIVSPEYNMRKGAKLFNYKERQV